MSHRFVRLLVPLLALLIALSAVTREGDRAAAAQPLADQATRWDAKVAPIAREVEAIRGLRFDHPVPVRFLSERAFRKEVTTDEKDLTKKDKRDIEQTTQELRALGLISGDVDLFDAVNTKEGSDTLAFYDPEEKAVAVRGKGPVDAATKVTLAHELTHVLQDQHFDLGGTEDALDDATTASSAFDALVEGDAVWVENEYASKLDATDRKAYDAAQEALGAQSDASTQDVPMIIEVLFGAPYILGPHLVDALRAHGGRAAVDRAFRNPPVADAQVLDPAKLLLASTTKAVPVPKPAKGEKQIGDADEFGALGLYLVLASRIPAAEAYAAASQWAGDREITVRDDGTTCVRAAFRGRTPAATRAIGTGLKAWIATMPAGTTEVTPRDTSVELRSCDPGTTVTAPADDRFREALTLLVERNGALNEALDQDATTELASCFADGVVQEPAFTDLISEEVRGVDIDPATEEALRSAAGTVGQRCRDAAR